MKLRALTLALVPVALAAAAASMHAGAQQASRGGGTRVVPWPYVAADTAASRYSPLDYIDRSNVGRLQIAWQWEPN